MESALTLGLNELTDSIVSAHPVGTLGHPVDDPHPDHRSSNGQNGVFLSNSSAGHSRIDTGRPDLIGHPQHDRFDNDFDGQVDEAGEGTSTYTGAAYRMRVVEWNTDPTNKIGAPNLDDDNDGDVDEAGEVNEVSTKDERKFTVHVTATCGNYATSITALIRSVKSSASPRGVYAENELKLESNSMIDSYDSSNGSYSTPPGKKYSNKDGNIATSGSLILESNADVVGDATYGGSVSIDPNARVHGQLSKSNNVQDVEQVDFPARESLPIKTSTNNTIEVKGTMVFDEDTNLGRTGLKIMKNATVIVEEGVSLNVSSIDTEQKSTFIVRDNKPGTKSSTEITVTGDWYVDQNGTIKMEKNTMKKDKTDHTTIRVSNDWDLKQGATLNRRQNGDIYVGSDLGTEQSVDVTLSNPGPSEQKLQVGNTLEISQNNTWNVEGDTEWIVQTAAMDQNFTMNADVSSGEMDFYADQKVELSSNGDVITKGGPPGDLRWFVGDPDKGFTNGSANMIMKSNTRLDGAIHAPTADFNTEQNIEIRGRLSAWKLNPLAQNSEIHIDNSIAPCEYLDNRNCGTSARIDTSWATETRGGRMQGF